MVKNFKKTIMILFLLILGSYLGFAQKSNTINSRIFQQPPSEYGIRCWWWWLNGNIDKETITRDLEEMKAKGFSGACIFDAGGADQRGNAQVPEGPMFASEEWKELYVHAIKEANRLGLVMSVSIQSGWNLGGPDITPAETAKHLVYSETKIKGGAKVAESLTQPETNYGYYRDIAVLAIPTKSNPDRKPLREFENKAAKREVGGSAPETRSMLTDIAATPGEEDAKLKEVLNITKYVKNGMLNWKAPAGDWTIIRLGFTPTHAEVSTASGQWQGHVIDYMSEKNFNRYWDTNVEPLLKAIGPLAGTTLKYLQTDSFEAGGMNWTEGFEQEFLKRRGYDPTPYLPVMAGKIIESRQASNNFLSDLRKTLGDLIAEKHYGTFARRARAYGIGIQPESAGPHAGPFDGLKNYGYSEIMMSEFWSPSPHRPRPVDRFFVKQAASAAKIFNKTLVGAESFTTIGPHWNDVIWSDMKPSVDHEFAAGLNLVYLHTFTASPKKMGLPGQEYFAGTHFNPQVTWWNQSSAFIDYLKRCQYILQNSRSYADVLYYYGDHVPNVGRYKEDDPAGAMPGYDYDLTNEDRLLALEVKDGNIVLPHGDSYKVLVLPNHKILSLAAIQKIETLIKAGATVIGSKPATTASLVAGEKGDKTLLQIADKIWANSSSAKGSRNYGLGKVVWGVTASEYFQQQGLSEDLKITLQEPGSQYEFIHRKEGAADFYFISSQNQESSRITASFRITGKQPELWNPVSGEIFAATSFYQKDGKTFLPLELNSYGSVFVVFKDAIETVKSSNTAANFKTYETKLTLHGSWKVNFDPKWGGPESVVFNELESWTANYNNGIKYYSGTAVYHKMFDLSPELLLDKPTFLDIGTVKDVGIAKIILNGRDLGILWCPPYRVSVAGLLKEKDNALQVEVTNSWRNRLIGDRGKPDDKKFTQTNVTVQENWQLEPSGLLGPVRLLEGK